MAAIVAADVTWSMRHRIVTPVPGESNRLAQVFGRITIDPGTTDTYPTGGIPLTNVFTTHTGLDTTRPISAIITPARNSAGVTVFAGAHFLNDPATGTPVAQTLVLLSPTTTRRATITGTGIAVANATSITDSGNGFVTAGFVAGQFIHVSGFITVPAANGVARIATVAAGTLTLTEESLTADTAGDTVTITSIDPGYAGLAEYAAVDVTLAGGIAAGDENIVFDAMFVGFAQDGV